ncbi:DUF1801 domain-containing protein [Microbacterium sp. NPDC089189]|uniref:iron chaperone n=1 Tax=Microbacterium sp. NPDC089189 TaxID=3154972 RepID=UPI003446B0EA
MATEQSSSVDAYIAGFPPEVAARMTQVREAILAEVPGAEEKMRYGIAAVMLGGRYALHYAGWKQHIGLYPVPVLPQPLESEVAPLRSGADTVVLRHAVPLPVDLISRIARAIVAQRAAADGAAAR